MEKQAVIWRTTYDKMKKKLVVCLVAVNLIWMGMSYVHYAVTYKPLVKELQAAFDGKAGAEMNLKQLMGAVHELKIRGEILSYLRTKGMSLGQGLDVADGVLEESKKQGLPVDLIMGVIKTESEFNMTARSGKGALGIMQIMPITWNDMVSKMKLEVGIQAAFDPRVNIRVGCAKLKELVEKYSTPGRSEAEVNKLVLSAYNAGESGGIQPAYVSKVSRESKNFVSLK